MDEFSGNIHILQRVHLSNGLMPPNLTQHAIGQYIIVSLSLQRGISNLMSTFLNDYFIRSIWSYKMVFPIRFIVNRRVLKSRRNISPFWARSRNVSRKISVSSIMSETSDKACSALKLLAKIARHGLHSFSGKSNRFGSSAMSLNNLGNNNDLNMKIDALVCIVWTVAFDETIIRNNSLMGHTST